MVQKADVMQAQPGIKAAGSPLDFTNYRINMEKFVDQPQMKMGKIQLERFQLKKKNLKTLDASNNKDKFSLENIVAP